MPLIAYATTGAVCYLRITGRWAPKLSSGWKAAFAVGCAAVGLAIVNAERGLSPPVPAGAGLAPEFISLFLVGGGLLLLIGSAFGEDARFRLISRALRIVGLVGIAAFLAVPSTLSLALPVAALFLADEVSRRPAPA